MQPELNYNAPGKVVASAHISGDLYLQKRKDFRGESYFTSDSMFVAQIRCKGSYGVTHGQCRRRYELYVSGHGKSEHTTLGEARATLNELTS